MPHPIRFRWDYFFRLVWTFLIMGAVKLVIGFKDVEKAYRNIGAMGFVGVAVSLLLFCLVVVALNYLWCRARLALELRLERRRMSPRVGGAER